MTGPVDTALFDAETLDKAADHIDTYRWWQGGFSPWHQRKDPKAACCAGGAINVVLVGSPGGPPVWTLAVERPYRALIAHLDLDALADEEVAETVGRWNDHPDRTAEEVTAALRACAERLRGGWRP